MPAVSFTGSQSGIITTGQHFDARIVEVRPERVRAELERGKVVIVAGYQGMSQAREITTLGRGGSDTTAVALAAALAAHRCEIYSDVDGVYSADPNRIREARHLPSIDYDTMEEMAEAGARVLNVHAVRAAREHGLAAAGAAHLRLRRARGRPRDPRRAGRAARAAVVVNPALWLVYGPESAREPLSRAARELELPLRALDPGDELPLGLVPLSGVPDPKGTERALTGAVPGLAIVGGYAELSAVGAAAHDEHRRLAAIERLAEPPLCVLHGTRRLSAIVSPQSRERRRAPLPRLVRHRRGLNSGQDCRGSAAAALGEF